jgi:hypothetical protein
MSGGSVVSFQIKDPATSKTKTYTVTTNTQGIAYGAKIPRQAWRRIHSAIAPLRRSASAAAIVR